MRSLLAGLILVATWAAQPAISLAQTSPQTPPHLYVVVLQITVGADGKILTLEVDKVIDNDSGSGDPVQVDLPSRYMEAVRAMLARRTYSTNPPRFYTYTFFDPAQPDRADIDARLK